MKTTKKTSRKAKDYFPDEKTLRSIREKLSDPNYRGGNFLLQSNASEVDKAKYQLCQLIAKYQREHDLLQKQLAKKLVVDEARVSDILRGKIEGFTLDRLISYAEILYPKVKLLITAA